MKTTLMHTMFKREWNLAIASFALKNVNPEYLSETTPVGTNTGYDIQIDTGASYKDRIL